MLPDPQVPSSFGSQTVLRYDATRRSGDGGEGLGGGGGGLGGGNTQHSLLRPLPHSPTTGPGQQFAVSGKTGGYESPVLGSNGQIHGP